jgi:hypothetical protein
MFEICKVDPTSNVATNSPTTPSAFNAYYTVLLRRIDGAPLPQTLTLNYLEFHGKISVNGFSSRINKPFTTQYSQTLPSGAPSPFFPLLAYDPENGEITWTLGTYESCSDVINQDDDVLELYPVGTLAPSSVKLFTIVVDGESGDMVKWNEKGGTYSDCVIDCNSDVTVSACSAGGAGLLVTFPTLNICNPTQTMIFNYFTNIIGQDFIRVDLSNLIPLTQHFNRIDGIIHLSVNTSGIPDIGFLPQAVSQSISPPEFDFYVKKNSDGTADIYFSKKNITWVPDQTVEPIFVIEILGQTNLSQGTSINCNLLTSRTYFNTNGPTSLCSFSAIDTEIVIPGYPQWPNKLQIVASPEFGIDCSLSINHKFNMVSLGGGPVTFSSLKIVLLFVLQYQSGSPGDIYTNLPDEGTYGSMVNLNTNKWLYTYERNTPITLSQNDFISIPFTLSSGCVRYFINYAEGTVLGNSTPCSFSSKIDLTNWPACPLEISDQVVLPGPSALPAPWVGMTLKSVSTPSYNLYTDSDCFGPYSFCPDKNYLPFTLQPVDISGLYHCACGVTAYDLVLINRHRMGTELLQKPYSFIAANVDESENINTGQTISLSDIHQIQFCLLGLNAPINNFGPKSSPSWRYFKDTYTINNTNPLLNYPYTGADISDVPVPNDPTSSYGRFTAVKMGDVDQSCKCSQKPAYITDNVTVSYVVNTDGTIRADFRNSNTSSMAAQWAIRFSAQDFKVVDVKPNYSVNINDASLGLTGLDEGILRFLWFSPDGSELIEANELLFSLVFERKENNGSSPMEMPELIIANEVLSGRAYNASGEEQLVKISTNADNNRSLAFIVQPNPLIDFADLFIDSQNEADASVRLETLTGFILFEQNSHLQQGSNVLRLQLPNLVPGSYYISIYDGKNIIRRQVIKSGL